MNKRGAEMTIGTIVIIVLAIIVLVVIALGFGTGWSNLWERITGFLGGGPNVDSVVQACSAACLSNSQYSFCSTQRELRYEVNEKVEKKTESCDYFATTSPYSGFGFETCSQFDCTPTEEKKTCEEQDGIMCTSTTQVCGGDPIDDGDISNAAEGQICCKGTCKVKGE